MSLITKINSEQIAAASGSLGITDAHIASAANISASKLNIPTASTSTAGLVKVDGTTVTISGGVISSAGGGGGAAITQQTTAPVTHPDGTLWIDTSETIAPFNSVSDTAYDATTWDGVTSTAPSKNAVRDKIEAMELEIAAKQASGTYLTASSTLDATKLTGALPAISGANLTGLPTSYTLPIAAAGTLGGIKIGTGLSIDGSGVVTAAGGSGASTSTTITANGSAFSLGNLVYYTGSAYAKADCTDPTKCDVVGIVTTITGTTSFVITTMGYVTGLSGLTAGTQYFLSSTGTLTATDNTTIGQVSKPVFVADSATSGYLNILRGVVIPSSASLTNPLITGYRESVTAYSVSNTATTTLADNISQFVCAITGTNTFTYQISMPTVSSAGETRSFMLYLDNQKSSGTVTIQINSATKMQSAALTAVTNGKKDLIAFTSINGGGWLYQVVNSVEF